MMISIMKRVAAAALSAALASVGASARAEEGSDANAILKAMSDYVMNQKTLTAAAKHIGLGVINGVECEHLAFRNLDTDWQIWVETGAKPIPRKFVITSKAVTGGPQYTLLITDWKTDAPIAADAFALKAPAEAKKIEFKDLSDIDEVPPGVVKGGKQ